MRIAFDTEFYNSNEKDLKPVCAVIFIEGEGERAEFDLYDPFNRNRLQYYLQMVEEEVVIVSYAVAAEARTLMALGIDPLQFKWIDLYAEFVMLCNSNNKYKYGPYIDKSGQEGFSRPPKEGEDVEESDDDMSHSPKNLINAVYKLLNVNLDSNTKNEMRDLILSKNDEEICRRMGEILEYCASDTRYLLQLDDSIQQALTNEGLIDFRKDQLERGRYAVCMGVCENTGLPIDVELLNKIISKTPEILEIHKTEVNDKFPFFIPEIQRKPKTFKNGKVMQYKPTPAKKDMNAYQKYVESLNINGFPKTETGRYRADKTTLEEWGYWGGLESLWKYNKVESSLKWFNKGNKDGFFERLGTDNRIRPYFGIFGTQTGRNAARAKTFPLAMSSWLRAIIRPPEGSYIIACDFSQQEVYVAAILSKDMNLLKAYQSGDVYLEFAKMAGLVPPEATKKSHKNERDLCKSTVLGLQFGMGKDKLRTKLILDSNSKPESFKEGKEEFDSYWHNKTEELIQAHKITFATYWQWVKEITYEYKDNIPLVTNDGFVLFCDNDRITSVRNFPVQGNGASITRRAVVLASEAKLTVLCSLHDAIYVESDNPKLHLQEIESIMIKATCDVLGMKIQECDMRIDSKIISHEETWVEEKGQEDWNKISKYL